MRNPLDTSISLTVPASAAYVPVVRVVVTGAAAVDDMPMDIVEDLRLAVTESCNRLLSMSPSAQELTVELDSRNDGRLEVRVSIDSPVDGSGREEGWQSLAWTILSVLADEAKEELDGSHPTITTRWIRPVDGSASINAPKQSAGAVSPGEPENVDSD